MQMQKYEQRILIPDEGKFLCNVKEKVISEKVYLAINADSSEWVEIDETEKQRLEAKWENETLEESM